MTISKPLRVNPPVGTEQQPIELGGGLDFTRPKLLAQPGSLLDCLNFEVVDRAGYARIAGFEPYDGTTNLYNYLAEMEALPIRLLTGSNEDEEMTALVVGATLAKVGAPTVPVGIVVTVSGVEEEGTGIWNYTLKVLVLDGATITGSDNLVVIGDAAVLELATTSNSTVDTFPLATRNAYLDHIRSDVTAMLSRPLGLHWFRDRLYAVAADRILYFTDGSEEPFNSQYIGALNGASLAKGQVIAVFVQSGDWATNDAEGFILYTKIGSVDFDIGAGETANVYTDDTFTTIDFEVGLVSLETFGEPATGNIATVWESRSAAQATAEGESAGWTRIDPGWEIGYESGYDENGELVKITKGVTPVFTPDSDDTGALTANILSQAIEVSSEIDQVQGWKSTADQTIFATTATAIQADDGTFLYGDIAAFSWGFNTLGEVKTQQPSGGVGANTSSGLAQYPPTGTTFFQPFTWTTPYSTTWQASNGYTYFILSGIDNISTQLPENARIVGITVAVKYDAEVLFYGDDPTTDAEIFTGFTDVRLQAQLMNFDESDGTAVKLGSPKAGSFDFAEANFTIENDKTSGGARTVRWLKDAESTITMGSSSDLWGLSTLSREDATSENFAIGFRCQVDCGTMTNRTTNDNILIYRPLIDYITVTLEYVVDAVRYYFKSGTDCIQGDLVYYNTVSGTFQSGDAAGKMQLVNVVKNAGVKYNIEDNMTIHTTSTLPASSTDQVGVVSSDMVYNGLPGIDSLLAADGRYQFITSNFYATDNLDGFYGVSGADRAFSVNTYTNESAEDVEYLVKITTNPLDEAGDTPRHVANHHYHLALGFESGVVRFSVPGEPENFDGEAGAAEVGVGDRVTGLLSMRGMTLGVFCENSIWGITGTDSENFTTQVLAPYTGAIEYTVLDMGIPMYCDSRGISTLEQSAAYGNFLGQRLSSPITPWILPRMVRNTDTNSETESVGVACAIPVRSKNQYRVFFRDGKVLSATINPNGEAPSFTFSTYYIGMTDTDETGKYLVPLAWSSQVDERGVERIHVAHYSATSDVSVADGLFVYELEVGWGFAGKFIPAYFTTNWYAKDPYSEKTILNIRMDGLSYGFGSTTVALAKEYEEVYNTATVPISLPPTPAAALTTDLKPTSNMAHVARTGRNLSIKIEDVIPEDGTIDSPVPSCIHQIMLTQYRSGGKSDS